MRACLTQFSDRTVLDSFQLNLLFLTESAMTDLMAGTRWVEQEKAESPRI